MGTVDLSAGAGGADERIVRRNDVASTVSNGSRFVSSWNRVTGAPTHPIPDRNEARSDRWICTHTAQCGVYDADQDL